MEHETEHKRLLRIMREALPQYDPIKDEVVNLRPIMAPEERVKVHYQRYREIGFDHDLAMKCARIIMDL